jgi:probable F420-dependent oxidoreductase
VIDFADASPVADLGPVGVWAAGFGGMRNDALADVAAEIEHLGYGSVWVPESPAGEPFVKSALVLAATTTLVAGTGIANLWLRHALTMTATTRALVDAFPGRFLLGVGVSHSLMIDNLLPEAYTKPLAVMREYLDGMDVAMPGHDPCVKRPPRVLAALGDRMLALARDRADGAHPYLVTPEHTAHAREVRGAGKLLVPEQAVVLSTDRAVVLERARAHLSIYLRLENYRNNWVRLGFGEADFVDGGSERLCDALVAGGDEATVRARVCAHLDAGADHVVIQALGDSLRTVPMDQLRALAPTLTV